MAVETPYTTEEHVVALAGQLAVDLRLDDSPDSASDLEDAIDVGTADADYYLSMYSQAGLAADRWVQDCATFFAIRWLCLRRLNELPASIQKECERREALLLEVKKNRTRLRVARSRRPAVVTTHTVDLRRYNNTVRVDRSKSTGVAQDYRRPTDHVAPDDR